MPLRASSRALLLRAAAALRRVGAALARAARGRPGPANGPSAPPPGEGEGAFLSQVKETLLEISTGSEPPAATGRGAADPGTGLRARLRRLAAFLQPIRRHEDLVLAVALLVGIAMMILHWVP